MGNHQECSGSEEVDQIKAGDYAGALGTGAEMLLICFLGELLARKRWREGRKCSRCDDRGEAEAASIAKPGLASAAGAAIGHATGIPGMTEAGAVAGGFMGRRQPDIPGEDFGLPEKPTVQADRSSPPSSEVDQQHAF